MFVCVCTLQPCVRVCPSPLTDELRRATESTEAETHRHREGGREKGGELVLTRQSIVPTAVM